MGNFKINMVVICTDWWWHITCCYNPVIFLHVSRLLQPSCICIQVHVYVVHVYTTANTTYVYFTSFTTYMYCVYLYHITFTNHQSLVYEIKIRSAHIDSKYDSRADSRPSGMSTSRRFIYDLICGCKDGSVTLCRKATHRNDHL